MQPVYWRWQSGIGGCYITAEISTCERRQSWLSVVKLCWGEIWNSDSCTWDYAMYEFIYFIIVFLGIWSFLDHLSETFGGNSNFEITPQKVNNMKHWVLVLFFLEKLQIKLVNVFKCRDARVSKKCSSWQLCRQIKANSMKNKRTAVFVKYYSAADTIHSKLLIIPFFSYISLRSNTAGHFFLKISVNAPP